MDASLQQAPDVVRMATRNGSAALGHETGQLTAGHKADLILVDLQSQMFTPLMPGNADHLFSHLVFAANGSCVDTTIIDGKIVMEGRRLTTVDEPKVLQKANEAFVRVLDKMVVPRALSGLSGHRVARYLVQGDPVVALGPADADPGRGADRRRGRRSPTSGRGRLLAARGPFDRVLGSADHFVMPGFVNCHYHSELAIGPGLYQHIFEKANVYIQGAVGPVDEEDLYYGILWGLVTAIKGGQTGTVDMYYGRTGMEHFGCVPALQAYADSGMRTAFGLVSRDQNIYAHQAD